MGSQDSPKASKHPTRHSGPRQQTSANAAGNQCPPLHAPDHGFTLIELAIVLLLMTILLGLALPRLRGQLLTNDLGRTTRLIGGLAQETRLCSMREGKAYSIQIDPGRHRLQVFREEKMADNIAKQAASREIKAVTIPDSVTIMDVWTAKLGKVLGPVGVNFSPKGRADQAVIHLQGDKGEQVSLVIEPFMDRVTSVAGYLEQAEKGK